MTSHKTVGTGIALALVACGGRIATDKGTESHWLSICVDDSDCAFGSCLCGRCTLECSEDTECRWPLDVCVAPGEDPALATCTAPPRGLCGISSAPEGTSRLSEALVIEREQCTKHREVRFVLNRDADVSGKYLIDDGFIHSVALANDEFVIAGVPAAADVSRVGMDGRLIARYTVEPKLLAGSVLYFKQVIARTDGQIALLGYEGRSDPDGSDIDPSPWIGILDADGRLSSEQRLDTGLDTYVKLWLGLEPLPGGGYVFARRHGPDWSSFLVWSKLDEDGRELWQRTVRIEQPGGQLPGTIVVTSDQNVQMLMTSAQDDEAYVVTSDLDGNYVEHRQRDLALVHGC
ncbi:MAG: hypothetical protein JW940_23925 [Polyangiaceae bacterium]|nr:hypothetical protein [Polyangiaceae bacterium]